MAPEHVRRRLFFALWPTEALRRSIERTTTDVATRAGGRKIPAENFHITLIFLGSVPEARLPDVAGAAAEVSAPPFDLQLDRLESWRRSGVLCLTAPSVPGLELLRDRLCRSLTSRQCQPEEGSGDEPDAKPFQPHVTLARRLPRAISTPPIEPFVWPVDAFVLVESRAGSCGSTYEVIGRWPLVGSA